MKDSIPVYSEKNLIYFRDEKDGYMSLIPKDHPETMELIVNATSKEIIQKCDGQKTISQIIVEMQEKYPEVKGDIIDNDVMNILNRSSRLGIVKWKGENPFFNDYKKRVDDQFSITFGSEENLGEIMKFLDKYKITQKKMQIPKGVVFYLNPVLLPFRDYNILMVRQKLFSFAEDFILLWQNGELKGIVTVSSPQIDLGLCGAGVINLILLNQEVSHLLDQMITYCKQIYPYYSIQKPTKIKFFATPKQAGIKEILSRNQFVFEANLKNEIEFNQEYDLYSYFFDEEFVNNIQKPVTIDRNQD